MQVSVGFIKKMHFHTLDTRGTVHIQTNHIQYVAEKDGLDHLVTRLVTFLVSTDILPALLANSQKASSNEAFGAQLFRPFIFSCGTL